MSGLPRNPKAIIPDDETSINIFGYTPGLGWGLSAVIIFGLCLVGNVYHQVRGKNTRTFHFLLVFGCAMEIVGYGFRVAAHYNPFRLINFVIQYFFIVTAPIFFAAAIYLSLATLTKLRPEYRHLSILSPKALVATFVVADCVTIAVQVAGAALVGVSESAQGRGETPPIPAETANHILLAGLVVQSFCFLIFLTILFTFLYRSARRGIVPSIALVAVILASALLIFLRTLFRLAESADGLLSRLMTNEALFGGLETVPVLVAVVLWTLFPLRKGVESDRAKCGADQEQKSTSL